MGSCISKCKPKKCYIEDFGHVQDKLVISSLSQPQKTPIIPVTNRISPLPLSPTISSSSSISSFTRTTTGSCSSVSSSSSVLSSKVVDRSFSNEFLWACVKENPHIIRINSIKEASRALSATTRSPNSQRLESLPVIKPIVASPPVTKGSATPKKRVRSSSPSATVTRQKSFRKEADYRLNSAYHLPNKALRSPSPSRRFSSIGDQNYSTRGILASTSKEICNTSSNSRRIVGPKVNALNSVSSSCSLRKENYFRPNCSSSSPVLISNHNPSPSPPPLKSCSRNRETFVQRISSKLDEAALRAALSQQENDRSITMENIDNPLIALDCFIFL